MDHFWPHVAEMFTNSFLRVVWTISGTRQVGTPDIISGVRFWITRRKPSECSACCRSGSERDLGDIQGLDDKFILIPFTNIGLSKFSYNPAVRNLANVLANTFTSRGSQTKKMFETTMDFKGVQAKFDKTIENTLSNLKSL